MHLCLTHSYYHHAVIYLHWKVCNERVSVFISREKCSDVAVIKTQILFMCVCSSRCWCKLYRKYTREIAKWLKFVMLWEYTFLHLHLRHETIQMYIASFDTENCRIQFRISQWCIIQNVLLTFVYVCKCYINAC